MVDSENRASVAAASPRIESAVCYRMQPSRQMFSGGGCAHSCSAVSAAETNHSPPCLLSDQQHTVLDLERVHRVALMITPQATGNPIDQAWEAVSTVRVILNQQTVPMTMTMQTVFVRNANDIDAFRNLFQAYYGSRMPPTSFIVQPPCGGQALAIEAWALGGDEIAIDQPAPDVMTVAYDGLRWIHIAGITSPPKVTDAYSQTKDVFSELIKRLSLCGASFSNVPRIWLYQGEITHTEQSKEHAVVERYRELNRARTDFFDELQSWGSMNVSCDGRVVYPASTGIGMAGQGLTMSALGLQTNRQDVRLVALENPNQVSAFNYGSQFSLKSPKFSRAMAVVVGDYVTTWISGTASILNSESVHVGDLEKQTHQSIDNIERLISSENFANHGVLGAGAQLSDLAKVRVYVKHLHDFEKCREVCRERLGELPIIYALADVCRSDLLVEIEGVAFSRVQSWPSKQ